MIEKTKRIVNERHLKKGTTTTKKKITERNMNKKHHNICIQSGSCPPQHHTEHRSPTTIAQKHTSYHSHQANQSIIYTMFNRSMSMIKLSKQIIKMNKDINKNIFLFRSAIKYRELKITNIIIKIIPNINRRKRKIQIPDITLPNCYLYREVKVLSVHYYEPRKTSPHCTGSN